MSDTTLDPALIAKLDAAREASVALAAATTGQKNAALQAIAAAVLSGASRIVPANELDLANGRANGLTLPCKTGSGWTKAGCSRLPTRSPNSSRSRTRLARSVRGSTLPNGLKITEVRVPFGVVGAIYEARPNVTIDIAALCLKSGNAAILRGGSAAENSNRVLVELIQEACASVGLPRASVQTIDEFGRDGATQLMRARGYVDVLIPRGSANLINTVVTESKVPVIETGAGVVHVFLDESADEQWSVDIVRNAKVQRPSVCNALETLLVHRSAARRLLPAVLGALTDAGVTVHADEDARAIFPDALPTTDEDWSIEHLSLDVSVRVVDDLDGAIAHIRTYSTGHTESIITNDLANAERFLAEVDSAVVMVNASTRFTDGGEFGFGAEVGISTQKLHARGPMGVAELTSTKWIVRGSGQIRG